jgi:hypothetical protein
MKKRKTKEQVAATIKLEEALKNVKWPSLDRIEKLHKDKIVKSEAYIVLQQVLLPEKSSS